MTASLRRRVARDLTRDALRVLADRNRTPKDSPHTVACFASTCMRPEEYVYLLQHPVAQTQMILPSSVHRSTT